MYSVRATLTAIAGLLLAWGLQAGPVVASDEELASARDGRSLTAAAPAKTQNTFPEETVIRRPEKSYVLPEPNVYQAIAAAITRAGVRVLTQDERQANADAETADITVRGRRLRAQFTRDAYGDQCFLAVGTFLKWQTVNGHWSGKRVSLSDLDRVLSTLEANGIGVCRISISMSNPKELNTVRAIIRELGLKDRALIGVNPDAGNDVMITFGRTK